MDARRISLGDNMIRRDCFWYRPWKDMGATFDQCNLAETAECPCTENCINFITKKEVDELIRAIQLGEIET